MVYQDLCEHTELALNKSLCIYNQTEKKTMKHFELLDERKLLQLIKKNQVSVNTY